MSPMPPVLPPREWPRRKVEGLEIHHRRGLITVHFGEERVGIFDSPWLLQWRLNRAIRRVKALHKRHQARDDKVRWVLEKASEAQGGLE